MTRRNEKRESQTLTLPIRFPIADGITMKLKNQVMDVWITPAHGGSMHGYEIIPEGIQTARAVARELGAAVNPWHTRKDHRTSSP